MLLKLLEEDLPMDVVFVFTAQEEVGLAISITRNSSPFWRVPYRLDAMKQLTIQMKRDSKR